MPVMCHTVLASKFIAKSKLSMNPVPWTVGHGPRLLEPFLPEIWISARVWGRRARAVVRGSRTLVDGFIKKELIPSCCLNANFVIGRFILCFQRVRHVS